MRLKGKGINAEALIQSGCYLIFGLLLFRFTYTGKYLNYVTPRMKPYLYGLSFLMVLWAFMKGKDILKPRYKNRMSQCLVLLIPILLLTIPPASPVAGAMVKSYSGSSDSMTPHKSGQTSQSGTTKSYEETVADTADETQEETEASYDLMNPKQELKGLDDATKTITIADEDYYAWLNEIGYHPDKYNGYTVVVKGFVFLNTDELKENEFALARLCMWCCSADMTPIGLMTDYEGTLAFKENDWVTVTGKIKVTDGYPSIKAEKIEAAKKPVEEYVYPY
jgi:putative membrane protein